MIKLKKLHTCSCGKVHAEIPDVPLTQFEDDPCLDGYYWHCSCKSTQLTLPEQVKLDTASDKTHSRAS